MTARIWFKSGYKYRLIGDYLVRVALRPRASIEDDFVLLDTGGVLTVLHGYAWDGPSGPTIDTLNFMRGSLVHDALYQLMRRGRLEPARWREVADAELRRLCREDGMSALRAWWVYHGVRRFGGPSADPKLAHAPQSAP